MSEAIKFILPDDRIPKAWYNIVADLPQPLPPVLNAATGKPVGPEDLAPLFPNVAHPARSLDRAGDRDPRSSARCLQAVASDTTAARAFA